MCIRALVGAGTNAHTDPLFEDLGMLKCPDMIKVELCKTGHKMTNNHLPRPITQLFKGSGGVKTHRYLTRNKRIPNFIAHKNALVYTSFLCQSIAMYSKLSYKLKSINCPKYLAEI